jgi:transposase
MSKKDILLENGTFNKNHAKVKEQRFAEDDFYDPQDLAQVKYEMLRTVRESEMSIEEVSSMFGFSRSGFYKIRNSFERSGVSSFVSGKTGPQNARKLTKEYQQFIDEYLVENPNASSVDIADVLRAEKELELSKRTIERYRKRKSIYKR